MYETFDNIVAIHRDDCSQLFFLFSGFKNMVGGLRPLGFVQKTKLHNRNVVLFKDPYMAGFGRGVSEEIPSLDAIVAWQRAYCDAHPQLREVYCIGVSAGSLPAIYAGYHLKAKAAWSFGARPPARKYWGEDMDTLLARQHELRRKRRMQGTNAAPLLELEECMIDAEIISEVRGLLSVPNGVTEYHLYYAPSNEIDSITHALIADLPGVTTHTVDAPEDYPYKTGPNWDHKVLPIIQHQGDLPNLFPPFA